MTNTEKQKAINNVKVILSGHSQRWTKQYKGSNGSPFGLLKLSNSERSELYHALKPIVGSTLAHILRDWRPTRILRYIGANVKPTTPESIAQDYAKLESWLKYRKRD